MKKKMLHSLFTVALCCAAAVFYSCNDDDDNGVEPAPARKLVSRLTLTARGEDSPYRTYDIGYYPDGAFAEMTLYERYDEDIDTTVVYFSRRDDRLIMSREGNSREEVYLLNDEGYIIMADPWALPGSKYKIRRGTMVFDYADGCLKSLTEDGFPVMSYVWTRGDMVSSIINRDYGENVFYSYTATENKMNIDPAGIFSDVLSGPMLMSSSGYLGAISKHLPAELKFMDDDYTEYTMSFTYTFDSGGYPVSVSALLKRMDWDEGSAMEEETVVRITYAE